jgi:hypothetical protein
LFGRFGKPVGELFGTPGATAEFVETRVADTAVKPDPQGASVAGQPMAGGHQFEKRLLDSVLGGGATTQHSVGKGGESVGSRFVYRPIGGVRPPTDPVDQIVQFVIVGQPCVLAGDLVPFE